MTRKSNLRLHAEHELELLMASTPEDAREMQQAMHDGLLRMVDTFCEEGHSGSSAGYALALLQKLLRFEPIAPLTGADDEWHDVSAASGGRAMWQNKRCSRVFKSDDGRAYDIEAVIFRDENGNGYTNRDSIQYVDFPYTPTTKIVDAVTKH